MDSEDRSLALGIVKWLPAYPNSCRIQYHENVKLSTRDSEEYTGHEKLYVFTVAANPRSKKSSTAPRISLRTEQPTSFWSFPRFWSNFIDVEVSNEEEYSIMRILYCYSLQQLIFLAFCNDFDTHIVIPEMTSEANSSHSPQYLGREHGNVKIINFENS